MPDHLHLFVSFDEERINLSRWMKALKGSLSAWFRNRHFDPPFWQKGFFDHVFALFTDRDAAAKWLGVPLEALSA